MLAVSWGEADEAYHHAACLYTVYHHAVVKHRAYILYNMNCIFVVCNKQKLKLYDEYRSYFPIHQYPTKCYKCQ